jgi:hypothetical protein
MALQSRARLLAPPVEAPRPIGPILPPNMVRKGFSSFYSVSKETPVVSVRDRKGIPFRIKRYEPHLLPLQVTDPRGEKYKKGRWLSPSKRGVPFCGPPTLSFARFLRNISSAYIQVLRQCQSIKDLREYRLCNKQYHDLARFFVSSKLVYQSDNVVRSLKVIGMSLRFAKKEHCSRASVNN